MRTSTSPTCDNGIRCPAEPIQGETLYFRRIKPDIAGSASHDLHRTDIFAHRGDRNTRKQELKLLGHGI
ncbi:Uncharacterised protein [Serratia marcescens]|uniref:Uncharacterized protein n=1 Tax=Serratia marcescens TaxID=615 RepID=A0A379ZM52_SERMA|nr:Uncharacterised protein [Serratia marcescens]